MGLMIIRMTKEEAITILNYLSIVDIPGFPVSTRDRNTAISLAVSALRQSSKLECEDGTE